MTAGRRSALVVANDTYDDQRLSRLRAPATDAEQLASVLRNAEIGGFEVEVSLNEPEHVVRRKVSSFFDDRGPDDLLLLHLSCHGVKDEDGRLYFATPDTEIDHLDATSLPADYVNRQMTKSRSRRIVLFLDCCYSGAFARGMMNRGDERMDIMERFDGRGRIVLTASSAMEYSFEGDQLAGEGKPSVFTSALVEGLATGEADRDRDGFVSVDELYDFAFDRVRTVTPSQTPGKWVFDVQGTSTSPAATAHLNRWTCWPTCVAPSRVHSPMCVSVQWRSWPRCWTTRTPLAPPRRAWRWTTWLSMTHSASCEGRPTELVRLPGPRPHRHRSSRSSRQSCRPYETHLHRQPKPLSPASPSIARGRWQLPSPSRPRGCRPSRQ